MRPPANPFRRPGGRPNRLKVATPDAFLIDKRDIGPSRSEQLGPDIRIRGPRGGNIKLNAYPEEVPSGAILTYGGPMTTLEYAIILGLNALGKKHKEHYVFQSEELRGEFDNGFGYSIVDFLLIDTEPFIALPANGNYWHYLRGSKIVEGDLEKLRRLQTEKGYDVIVADEDDVILNGAILVINLAYARVDISQLAGRI